MGVPKEGNVFLLKEGDGASTEAFVTVAALRATSYQINGEEIDATDKDDAGWRDLLPGGGLKTMSISADGIYETGETEQQNLRDRAMDGSINNYQLDDGEEVIEGAFQVTSFEVSGDLNEVQQFSVTLESAGGAPSVSASA